MILSRIWKNGGIIERLPDGQLELKNHQKIPLNVLKAAEPIFDEIDAYLKSVEGMDAVSLTNWKIIMHMCGWLKNDAINNFLNGDEQAVPLAYDFQGKLAGNGWSDIYVDYRQYENDDTDKLKNELYKRAVAFAKGVK